MTPDIATHINHQSGGRPEIHTDTLKARLCDQLGVDLAQYESEYSEFRHHPHPVVVIAGMGPAGLAAGAEVRKRMPDAHILYVEKGERYGGTAFTQINQLVHPELNSNYVKLLLKNVGDPQADFIFGCEVPTNPTALITFLEHIGADAAILAIGAPEKAVKVEGDHNGLVRSGLESLDPINTQLNEFGYIGEDFIRSQYPAHILPHPTIVQGGGNASLDCFVNEQFARGVAYCYHHLGIKPEDITVDKVAALGGVTPFFASQGVPQEIFNTQLMYYGPPEALALYDKSRGGELKDERLEDFNKNHGGQLICDAQVVVANQTNDGLLTVTIAETANKVPTGLRRSLTAARIVYSAGFVSSHQQTDKVEVQDIGDKLVCVAGFARTGEGKAGKNMSDGRTAGKLISEALTEKPIPEPERYSATLKTINRSLEGQEDIFDSLTRRLPRYQLTRFLTLKN